MTLEEIFKQLSEKLVEVSLYQRAAKDAAKKELEFLSEQTKIISEMPDAAIFGKSTHAMYFYDPRTGTARNYAFRERSLDDRTKQVYFQKNKQYCWLLTEAYEEFEDFLERIYAFIGFQDNNAWPMSDYGKSKISDLNEKPFDWYLIKAINKKDIPQSILNHLRKNYPNLVAIETQNKLNVNLRVAINQILYLRHRIVHKSGKVDDK